MHSLVVFDHPYGPGADQDVPHHRSLSAALLTAALEGLAEGGHTYDVLDLAAEGFDPVMAAAELRARRTGTPLPDDVLALQARLAAADHLVLVHPTWWTAMPAGTKGFLDRVLTPGFAYDEPVPGRPLVRRLHRLQAVTVLTPMTSPGWAYRWWFAQPGRRVLDRGTFRLIGIPKVHWMPVHESTKRSQESRAKQLARVRRHFASLPAATRPLPVGAPVT